jgi:hypothetical protein
LDFWSSPGPEKSASSLGGRSAGPIRVVKCLPAFLSAVPSCDTNQRAAPTRPSHWESVRISLCAVWDLNWIKDGESRKTCSHSRTLVSPTLRKTDVCSARHGGNTPLVRLRYSEAQGMAAKVIRFSARCGLVGVNGMVLQTPVSRPHVFKQNVASRSRRENSNCERERTARSPSRVLAVERYPAGRQAGRSQEKEISHWTWARGIPSSISMTGILSRIG